MPWTTYIALGLVQGLTEFLPVSSSGHLNLLQHLIGLSPQLSLDIFLNTATLLSVLVFFRHRIPFFIRNWHYIIVGSFPAGIVGLLFQDSIENIFARPGFLPLFFLVTSAFLFSTRYFPGRSAPLNAKKAFVIGTFQALAILPGISRSGSTIFAGLLLGLDPASAFIFSFALFIPASLGALLLGISQASLAFSPWLVLGFIVAFATGLIALRLLSRALSSHRRLWPFSLYTFGLFLVTLILT